MRLFLRNGYGATSIEKIATESGVSRTTVFRYWGSKSDIIWSEFDHHVDRLAALLATTGADVPTMTAVHRAAVENLRRSMEDSSVWLERFEVIETAPELRNEEAARWTAWAAVIADHVAARHGQEPDDVIPQSIGAAVQAGFLAVLRRWRSREHHSSSLLSDLEDALAPLCTAMQSWLPDPSPSAREPSTPPH